MADDLYEVQQAQAASQASPPQQAQQSLQPPPRRALPVDQPVEAWRPADGAQPLSINPAYAIAQPSAKTGDSGLRAFGDQVWASTLSMAQGVLGAASYATRAASSVDPFAGTELATPDFKADQRATAWIEQQKRTVGEHIAATIQDMTPEAQQALSASLWGGKDENGAPLPTPGEVGWGHYIGAQIAGLIPQAALAILPGGLIGRAISAAGFGAIEAGDAYNALVTQVDKAKPAELMTSPVYAELRKQGMDDTTARQTMVGQLARTFVPLQFGVGAAAGAGIGGVLTHGAAGAAGRGLAARVGIGAAEGAATMGGQAGAQDYLEQKASQGAGTQGEYDPQRTAMAVATGALGGALLGGAGGTLHGAPEAPRQVEAKAEEIKPVSQVGADMQQALQLELPLDQANPGFVPGSSQGELFRTTDEANAPKPATPPAPAAPAPPAPAAPPASARPSDGIARQDLIETLKTVPNQDPKILNRMKTSELQDRYDQAVRAAAPTAPPEQGNLFPTVVAPDQRAAAQAAVASPAAAALASPPTPAAPATGVAAPPKRITASDVQRRDKVGFNEAQRRADAENAAQGAPPPPIASAPAVEPLTDHPVDKAAAEAAPPSPAQAEAGNYQKGHLRLQGLDVTIETPRGGVRRGPVDPATGKPSWETTMPAHYGYVRGSKGADGDHVDVTLGPRTKTMFDGTPDKAAGEPVFIVDQIDPKTGKFDEHKAMVGFHTAEEARQAYDQSFSDGSGPARRGAITEKTFEDFKTWLDSGNTTKPLAYTRSDFLKRQAAAKRSEQKARLAKPGERQQGKVATVEAPERAAPGEHEEASVEQRRTEAVQKLTPEAVGKIIQVRKGADIKPIVAKVVREITSLVGKTDGSPDAIAEKVDLWSKVQPKGPIPGTTTGYRDIANHVAQLMTNRPLPDRAEFRASLAREARQPSVFENEGAARQADLEDKVAETSGQVGADEVAPAEAGATDTTVGEGTEAESQGVADYGAGAPEKTRSPLTTNQDRILGDLERKVLDGTMTAKEADAAYGRKAEGSAGRARKYPTFSDWLIHRLQEANDPALRAKLASTDRITAESKSAARVLDPEYQAKIRDALKELGGDDEATAASKRASALEAIKAKTAKPQGRALPDFRSRAYADVLRDPGLEHPIRELLGGPRRSVHDYLDAIIKNPILQRQAPAAAALARRLRTLVDPEVSVRSSIDPEIRGRFTPDSEIAGRGDIELNLASRDGAQALLHETVHAVTLHYLDNIPENHPDMEALRTIASELQQTVESRELPQRDANEVRYALSDPHETLTMLMTNPELQQFAASVKPSAEFRQKMSALGYPMQAARSAWAAFTAFVRRALGLKGAPTPDEASLLDHVLRPLQDIVERAAEWNRGEDAGSATLDAATHALPDFGRLRDQAADRIDPAGLADRGRRAVLAAATTDGIVNWNRALFDSRDPAAPGNALEAYRSATEGVAQRSKAFRDEHAETVNGLLTKSAKLGAEHDAVAKLMNDATIAGVKLGEKANNDHLKTPEQQRELRALQSRYNGLSKDARAVYDGFRAHYAETYRSERDAQLQALIKTFMPDATGAQAKALTEAVRTKAGIKQLIDDPDASPVAREFAEHWETSRALVRGIAKVHNQGFVQGDYFPLRRYGDYVVHYGNKGTDDYGVEMFERRSQAEARRAELVKQGAEPSQVLDKRTSKLRAMVPTTVVDEFEQAMARHPELDEHADDARQLLQSVLLQHASHSEAARMRMRRQGVQGASVDINRVLASDFLGTASRMGYLEHGPDRTAALEAMRRHSTWLGDHGAAGEQIRAQAVIHELEQRMPSGDDASGALTGIARRFSTLGFVQSLLSPSHMLTSTIEAHMNSSSLLGARHGVGRAGLALAKALTDISPTMAATGARNTLKALGKGLQAADWNLSNVVRDRLIAGGADKAAMTDLFSRLNNAGLIDHSMVRELQRIANPGTDITQGWWHRFLDLNAAGAHAVDVANKTAIAKAAYDLELRKTGSHDQAARYAVETVRQSTPNYNLANKARIATDKGPLGAMAGPLTQFKQYGLHMYSMMANLVRASINGASKQERREARRAFAGILATHAMMAGTLTLLGDPLRWIGGAYDWATGADRPHDYENDVRGWISDAFGPELGEVIARGVPHAAGIDIHRRVGLANLLEPPELKSFSSAGYAEAIAAAMTGAAGEDATTMAGGMSKILHGDITGGLKDLVPRIIRDPMKADALATQGVTDSKGKTILPADKLSTGDIAAQAVGFQPSRVSEFREGRFAVQEARQEATSARGKIMAAFVAATPDDRHDVLEQVQQFNHANPAERISYAQLLQAVQRQRKQASAAARPGSFGLAMPKQGASSLTQAGRFANAS